MKKIWFILIGGFFALSSGAQTGIYHSFPENSMWRVDYYYNNPFQFPCYIKHYFDYSMNGDTTINSLNYKKIYRSFVKTDTISCDDPLVNSDVPQSGYIGALRDDEVANKTFFMFPGTNADSLLYDYNLQAGDTLKGFISRYFSNYTMAVLSVDSVQVGGNYRKRWNFEGIHNHDSYIIQGIGSSFGLIENAYTYAWDFTERFLVCLTDDDEVVFTSDYDSEMGCSPVIQDVTDAEQNSTFKLFPNPMVESTALRSDVFLKDATLLIYNQPGRLVSQIEHVTGFNHTIFRSNLTAGMYFLVIKQKGVTLFTVRLMVI